MMMQPRLRIPPAQLPALKALTSLTPEQREELLRGVRAAAPTLDLDEFGKQLAVRSLEAEALSGILDLLIGLHGVRESFGLGVDEFVREIRLAIEDLRASLPEVSPVAWSDFERFVAELLSTDGGLALTAKALFVSREYGNLYCTSRLLTDLRPIFGSNVEDPPATLVAAHTLKITYHEGVNNTKDFFVSLDRADIVELIATLERALKKEESLKKLTEVKGITLLEVSA